jgi:F-type H+-transporting ATPase subunit b
MIILGIADLGINLPVLIAQIVNFTILLVILRLVAWGPLTKMLDERRERIAESLSAADQAKAQAAESGRLIEEQLDASRREGQAMVAQAQEVAARIQAEARSIAQADADALLGRARDPARARPGDRRAAEGIRGPDDRGGGEGDQRVA